ncbi:MAG: hypothetical protein ACAI44_21565 [Candidatus Sericytochromatia bacterium]
MLRRTHGLMIASDQGFLRPETTAHLAGQGYRILAAASDSSRGALQKLNVGLLPGLGPDWPTRAGPKDLSVDLPQAWRNGLRKSSLVLYATEPKQAWAAWPAQEPDTPFPYRHVERVGMALFNAALEADVNWFVLVSSGKSLHCTPYGFEAEENSFSYKWQIDDDYEYHRGRLAFKLQFRLYRAYDEYCRKHPYGWLNPYPRTTLIVLFPEYVEDPGDARPLDMTQPLAGVHLHSFYQNILFGNTSRSTYLANSTLREALDLICRNPGKLPGAHSDIWLSGEIVDMPK